jgi:hypothetical protein
VQFRILRRTLLIFNCRQVGDQIIIASTDLEYDDATKQSEKRTITAINGRYLEDLTLRLISINFQQDLDLGLTFTVRSLGLSLARKQQ